MPSKRKCQLVILLAILGLLSSGCVNNSQKLPVPIKGVKMGAGIGMGVGAVVGSVAGNTLAGAVAGGVVGSVVGLFNTGQQELIAELAKLDIQYVEYGDTHVLIVPTDRYFEINTHRFNDACYIGLMNITRLLRRYPCSMFYVAGFTDDIGTRKQKQQLSQSRADAIVTLLWAHDIRAQNLNAEGYGDKHSIGDNKLIHGSAYNRRIEIQWVTSGNCVRAPMVEAMDSK